MIGFSKTAIKINKPVVSEEPYSYLPQKNRFKKSIQKMDMFAFFQETKYYVIKILKKITSNGSWHLQKQAKQKVEEKRRNTIFKYLQNKLITIMI